MAGKTLRSSLIVSLFDRATGPAKKIVKAVKGIGKSVEEVNGIPVNFGVKLNRAIKQNNRALAQTRGQLLDAVAGFYTLKAAISAPVGAAMDFESAMADVRKVVDFPTPEALLAFKRELVDLSKEIPITVAGLTEIAAAAGQAGIAGEDLTKFTEAAAKIGTAFDISADEAGSALAKLMTGLGLTIDEAISLSDAMNHLSNSQASSAAEILDVVRRVGATAKQYGFTAEQVSAFASAMIAAGAESEVAATSFRNMGMYLTRGASATKRQSSAMKQLGLDTVEVAKRMQEDAVGTTIDVLKRIAALPKELQASVSSDIFGNEARALGPLLTNIGLLEESLGMVADKATYAGSAFKEFENRNATFGSKLQRFRNVMEALMITIGDALIPVLSDLIEKIAPVVEAFARFVENNQQLVAGLMIAVGGLIAFRSAVIGLKFIGLLGKGGALQLMATGLKAIGGAGWIARGGLRVFAGGFGLVATALRAVVALMIANPIGVAVAAIAGAAYLIYKNWDTVAPYFKRLWEAVKRHFGGFVDFIVGVFTLDFERALKGLKDILGGALDFYQTLFDAGAAMFRALWDGMKSIWTSIEGWIGGVAGGIADKFRGVGSSIKGFFGGGDGGDGTDGARAKGGPISRGKSYWVGENGPERITASRSGYVQPTSRSMSGGGGVSIGSMVINAAPGQSAREVADEVVRRIGDAFSSGFNGVHGDGGMEVYD